MWNKLHTLIFAHRIYVINAQNMCKIQTTTKNTTKTTTKVVVRNKK